MQRCRFHVDNDILHTFHHPHWHILLHLLHPKRPLPAHSTQASGLFIFPYFLNCCKPRSFYFSMLRLRLTLFPLLFNCCKPCSFLFFYAAFVGLLFPLLFVSINHPRAQQLPRFRRFPYFFFKKLIMPRSCAPTCSAWVCAARRRIALNCGRPHWFSSSHFLAKVPS